MSIESSDAPLISVVMPVFNGAPFLAESIGSILAQTYANIEFVIVEDGSTDNSARIVRDYAARDARIRPLFTANRGAQRARNLGVAAAQGELIAHLDQDNIALKERLATQLAWMRKNYVDVCGTCISVFGDSQHLQWYPEKHADILRQFLFRTAMVHSTTMLPAQIAKANPFDERVTYGGYELLTRLAAQYRLGNVPQVLLKYRTHPRQSTAIFRDAVRNDQHRFRERLFHVMFPQATAEDYAAIARVADQEPFPDLLELERAGKWLVRLADTRDNFLRERMTDRWRLACLGSAQLGLGCFSLYKHIALELGVSLDRNERLLWLACKMRLRAAPRIENALHWIRTMSGKKKISAT